MHGWREVNMQACKQERKLASKEVSKQAGRQASRQASKQSSKPALRRHSVGAMPCRGLLFKCQFQGLRINYLLWWLTND